MDRRLQLIAHLYEEELDGLEPLERLLEDPELREEYRTLRESRFTLDHRGRARPDARVLDAILAEAAPRPGPGRRWADRPALRLVRTRRVLAPALAIAAMVLVAIAVYPLLSTDRTPFEPQLAGKAEAEHAPAESLLRSLPPAPPASAPPAADLASSEALAAESGDVQWDDGRSVRRLSRRIEALRSAGVDAWDGPAVPLEMMPTDPGSSGIVPAEARSPRQ